MTSNAWDWSDDFLQGAQPPILQVGVLGLYSLVEEHEVVCEGLGVVLGAGESDLAAAGDVALTPDSVMAHVHTVVGVEHDEGVLPESMLLQPVEQSADCCLPSCLRFRSYASLNSRQSRPSFRIAERRVPIFKSRLPQSGSGEFRRMDGLTHILCDPRLR